MTYPDIEIEVEIDEDQLTLRSSDQPVLDESVKFSVRKNNRILLTSVNAVHHTIDDPAVKVTEISFQLDAILHTDCVLHDLMVTVSFPESPDCRVEDLAPDTVTGKDPVKFTTTYKAGLSFEWGKAKIGPNADVEQETEKNIYYPEIITHGKRLSFASWTFRGREIPVLDIKKEFHLLLSRRDQRDELPVSYALEGQLRLAGWPGSIPIIGRRQMAFTAQDTV